MFKDPTRPRFERFVRLLCERDLERNVESHKFRTIAFSHGSLLLSEPLNMYRQRQKVINKLDVQASDFKKDGDDVRSRRSPLLSGDVKDVRHQKRSLQKRPLPSGCGTRGHIPLSDGIEDYATDSETLDDYDSDDESEISSIESDSSASTLPPTSPPSPIIAQLYFPTEQVPPRARQSVSPTRLIPPKCQQPLIQAQQDPLNLQLVMQHLPQNEQPLPQPACQTPQPGKKRGRIDRSTVASMGPRKKNRLGLMETEDDVDWSDVRQFLKSRGEERQPLVSDFGLE